MRLGRRKLVALNGLLSQTQRPRHRTTRIIEARYSRVRCPSVCILLLPSSLSLSFPARALLEVHTQFMVLVNSYERFTKHGRAFTA